MYPIYVSHIIPSNYRIVGECYSYYSFCGWAPWQGGLGRVPHGRREIRQQHLQRGVAAAQLHVAWRRWRWYGAVEDFVQQNREKKHGLNMFDHLNMGI